MNHLKLKPQFNRILNYNRDVEITIIIEITRNLSPQDKNSCKSNGDVSDILIKCMYPIFQNS